MAGIDAVLTVDPTTGLYDFSIDSNGDIESADFFDTAILYSLFGERRASADEVVEPQRRRGWIGNGSDFENGSKLWLLRQARLTRSTLNSLQDEAEKALQWLVDDGHAVSISDIVASVSNGSVVLSVTILRSRDKVDRRLFQLWELTGRASIIRRPSTEILPDPPALPPLDLLAKYGVNGLWLDYTTSTVFEDSAGTTPASDTGVVGRVEDKSGGDFHQLQTITARKPIFHVAGSEENYISCDTSQRRTSGVSPLFGSLSPNDATFVTVVQKQTTEILAERVIWSLFEAIDAANFAWLSVTAAGLLRFQSAGSLGVASFSFDVVETDLLLVTVSIIGTSYLLRVNGVTVASGTLAGVLDFSPADTLMQCAIGAGTNVGDFDIHYQYFINSGITATETDQLEAYIAAQTGVTL